MANAVTDDQLIRALSRFVSAARLVIANPDRWLGGAGASDEQRGSRTGRWVTAARQRVTGTVNPSSPDWWAAPVADRLEWWEQRIGVAAGALGAAAGAGGVIADRLSLHDGFSAACQALGVSATAHEYGTDDARDWVMLIAKAVFRRDLVRDKIDAALCVPEAHNSATEVLVEDPSDSGKTSFTNLVKAGLAQAPRSLWGLSKSLGGVSALLEERHRGGRLVRLGKKVPIAGAGAGVLDERAGLRKAMAEANKLLASGFLAK